MEYEQTFVSVGSLVKKIHESRPELKTQEIAQIIQAATIDGKIDEEKAIEISNSIS